jgi:trans-2,3-dihydro-3-hydroxyanthranilate isomerase
MSRWIPARHFRGNPEAFAAADAAYRDADDRFCLFLHAALASNDSPLRCRLFAPLSDITEDPATGSAAGALQGVSVAGRSTPAGQAERPG